MKQYKEKDGKMERQKVHRGSCIIIKKKENMKIFSICLQNNLHYSDKMFIFILFKE